MVKQKPGSPSRQIDGPRQRMGVHHPNSRAHTKVWESMVKMSKKKYEKGWKWVKVGENPKMPYPPCERSIKSYARANNDAPSITKYGSPVRLDAQIVALCPHCAKGAPMVLVCSSSCGIPGRVSRICVCSTRSQWRLATPVSVCPSAIIRGNVCPARARAPLFY